MSKFKVGDRVRRVKHSGTIRNCPVGFETVVKELVGHTSGFWYRAEDGSHQNSPHDDDWELADGPVRTVTRREIVPGCYGRVIVRLSGKSGDLESHKNWVSLDFTSQDWNADELRSAAMVLTQIAEALDENKGEGE